MLQYVNRARKVGDGSIVYWVTEDDPDPLLQAPNAPSPANDYGAVVVVDTRAVRAALIRIDLTSQVNGTRTIFDLPAEYYAGSLHVFDSGQRLRVTDFAETSATSFSLPYAPAAPSAIEVSYRPA